MSAVLRTFGALLLCLPVTVTLARSEADVKLLVRTPLVAAHGTFDAKTQAWLDGRQFIRVAFWGGAQPPLHIGYDPSGFEGVTADVLGVLQQMLGVQVRMRRFADRAAAEQAMARGEIDLLAINVVTEPETPLFKPSIAYLLNNKVTVRRADDALKPHTDLSGERVAYIATTPEHLQRIKEQYPNSQLIPYVNHMNALASLAYAQVDAFRTNAVTAEYLLSSFQRNNLYIADDGGATRVADINFAVNSQYPLLLKAINQSLAQIPVADMLRITSNWGLGTNFVIADKSFEMTPAQSAWVAEHRRLKVIVVDSYAPLTFLDERNRLSGLSADLLRQIERITGLQFEVIYSNSIADMVEKLQNGEVDVIAAMNTGSPHVQASQFTRPYLVSPYVVVTRRAESDIQGLHELNGLRMALPWGNPLSDALKKDFPRIKLVEVRNAAEGLEKLAAGEVEATVHTQYGADYFISHHFQADLHIASVIGPRPARVAMAVGPDNDVLKSILNGALLQIRPDESRALIDRWRVHEPPAVASSWRTYRDVVYTVIAAAILFALVFLVWNHALRSNIQKRQKAERDLEDQLHFTRTLIDEAPVALYVRDEQGRLAQCNQAYLDFFGGARDSLIGKNLIESQVFNEEFSARYHEMYLQTLQEQRPVFADIDVEFKGETFRVYHWVLPFHNADGQYIGVIGGWLDVTEREHLTEKLRLANEKAVSASRSKSVFLASMSHEIRTPVSALVGLIELLRLKGPDAHTQDDLETAHQTAQSLLSLVGDILDLSKIEAGEMLPSPQATHLGDLAQSIYRLFKPNADNKHLDYRLVLEVQNNGVMIDKLMLNQIVSNLLSNAIKFTDQGSVQLLMRELPGEAGGGRGRYAIQVSDTGRGLTAQQCQEIFEPFVQADPQAHRALGTGLGLSICASLSKLLNAQLIVDSQPGLGSRFTLTFEVDQVEVSEAATLPLGGSQSDQKLKVLVVEDHAPNRLVLCKQLEFLGHEVVPCEDGETALEQWLQAETPFDLTITDCGMPRMDGYELAEAMREVERQRAVRMHTIFGLTANAQAEITQRCLEAGMNRCLFKPVSIETLATLMAELAQASKRRALAATSVSSELEKLRLLSPESHTPLVMTLIQTHQDDARQLEDCVQTGNLPELIKIAHKVRGGAQLAGDAALMDACRAIECLDEQADPKQHAGDVNRLLTCLYDLERRLLKDLS